MQVCINDNSVSIDKIVKHNSTIHQMIFEEFNSIEVISIIIILIIIFNNESAD